MCGRITEYVQMRRNFAAKKRLKEETAELLKSNKKKIATAESCTAGLLSKTITEVSGASEIFELGISAYANHIKQSVLGVSEESLKSFGAVSQAVAEEMAEGVRKKANADIGIGITGVAGPKCSERKPVGTVFVALSDGKKVFVKSLKSSYFCKREIVREMTVLHALDMVRTYLIYGSSANERNNLVFDCDGSMSENIIRE